MNRQGIHVCVGVCHLNVWKFVEKDMNSKLYSLYSVELPHEAVLDLLFRLDYVPFDSISF